VCRQRGSVKKSVENSINKTQAVPHETYFNFRYFCLVSMTCFWSLVDPYVLVFRNTSLVLPAIFVKLLLSFIISDDLFRLYTVWNQTNKLAFRPKCARQMIIANYTRRPQNTGSYIVMKCIISMVQMHSVRPTVSHRPYNRHAKHYAVCTR